MKERSIRVVVAALEGTGGIGLRQQIPWHLPTDMKHFRALTTAPAGSSTQYAVIMGRKTWESLPAKVRPMPKRYNVVLTRDAGYRKRENVPDAVGCLSSIVARLSAFAVARYLPQASQVTPVRLQQRSYNFVHPRYRVQPQDGCRCCLIHTVVRIGTPHREPVTVKLVDLVALQVATLVVKS